MNQEVQDIINLYQQIYSNLDLELQRDITIEQLINEKSYCIIFRIMFPFLEKEIDNIQKERNPTGEKLQGLIEFLSYPVLTMDLSHISGNAIAQGDLRHLYNFLQILLELSKLYKEQAQSRSHMSSSPYDQNSEEQGSGIFVDPEQNLNQFDDSDNNRQPKQMQRTKSERNFNNEDNFQDPPKKVINNPGSSKKGKASAKDDSGQKKAQNQKENQQKALIQNIIPITQLQQRVLTKDPNLATKYKDKQKKKGAKQSQKSLSPEDIPDDQLDNLTQISAIDYDFLDQQDEEDINKLDEDDPIRQKYIKEIYKMDMLKLLDEKIRQQEQSGEPEIDDVIDQQIQIIKQSLLKMKQKQPSDDKETLAKIIKNRNQYKEFLKDYLKTYQQKQKKQETQQSKQQLSQKHQSKMNQKKKDDLKKEFENEHLSMYYKLRDEKLNYLRKIHRIIFELEKRKIIDEKKDHLQVRRQQNIITRNALASVENAYNDKIQMLKEKLQTERKERHIAGVAQKSILSKLEKELKEEKMKQIQELKDVWRQEKERFDYLMKDDGELEKRILQIYKKY